MLVQCLDIDTRAGERCAAPRCRQPAAHRVTITDDYGDLSAKFFLCHDSLDEVMGALELVEHVLNANKRQNFNSAGSQRTA
ncbi:MAG: hypothetical protein WCA22_21630 [Candidatus Binatus sp.]